jgi:PKD repeat protein
MSPSVTRRKSRLAVLPLEAREVPAYVGAPAAFEPNDLTAGNPGVTTVIAGTDDDTATVNLGGNTFNFYGTVVSSLVVSTNGLISIGSAVANDQDNTALTTDPAEGVIAPLWDDWLKTTGQPMVLTSFDGSRLIVEWDQVKSANLPPTSSPVTFQAILELNTGNTPGSIKFNYLDIDTGNDSVADNGAGATVGTKTAGVSATSPNPGPTRTLVWKDGVTAGGLSLSDSSAIGMAWQNAAPVVTTAGLSLSATPITEGGTVRLSGTFDEADVTDGHTVSINWGDGTAPTVFTLPAGETSFADMPHVYANNPAGQPTGAYTITVSVTDTPGATGSASIQVGVFAAAPALALSVPATVNVNEGTAWSAATLATFTNPGFGPRAAYTYSINWGDGTAADTGSATITQAGSAGVPTAGAFGGGHTYGDDGTYTVTVAVADEDGLTSTRTFQVVVADVAPTLTLAVAPTVAASEGAQLSIPALATFTDPGFGVSETFTYSINWGDGTAADTGDASITTGGSPGVLTEGTFGGGHTYSAAGNFTVTVTVTDDNGGSDTKTFTAAVADVAPTNLAVALNRNALIEGDAVRLSGSFVDIGAAEGHTLSVDWGDGSPVTTLALSAGITSFSNLAHTYVNNPVAGNIYLLTATVENAGGLSTHVNLLVTVDNELPTPDAGPALETLVGQPVELQGSATDPGLADPLTYAWTVFNADGVPQASGSGQTFTFTPTQPGVYTAEFTVTDDIGTSVRETTIRVRPVNRYAVGSGTKGAVKVFDGDAQTPTFSFHPYGANFRGGVRVAVGDVTGDAIPDVITAARRSLPVKVFDGATGLEVDA